MEKYFLQNSIGKNIIVIGSVSSGKTFMCLSYVHYALVHDLYEEIHLIAPQFNSEMNNSYAFLKKYKDKVFVYTEFDESIINHVEKRRYSKKILFVLDDCTGQLNSCMSSLLKIFSTCRHGKGITTFLITHASKVASLKLRALAQYIFITNITSEKMLICLFEDYVSLYYKKRGQNFNDFFNQYEKMIDTFEYPQMLISRGSNGKIEVDFECANWEIIKLKLKDEKQKPTPKLIERPKTTVIENPKSVNKIPNTFNFSFR